MRAGERLELLRRIGAAWPGRARRLLVGLSEAGGHGERALDALARPGGASGAGEIRRLRAERRGGERLVLAEILRPGGERGAVPEPVA